MHQPRRAVIVAVVLALPLALSWSCGGSASEPGNRGPFAYTNVQPPANGVARFTVLPTAIAPGLSLTALGNLNPPGHVLPTDHVYFYDADLSTGAPPFGHDIRDVFMPTTATVFFLLPGSNGEYKVMFRATPAFYFYFEHLVLSPALSIGQVVQAGTKLGTTSLGAALDLGVFDTTVTHTGFVNPARYPFQTFYYASPWKYFTPDLQGQIYQHLYRAPGAADRDGAIDFGVRGRLVGDWFVPGMPIDSSSGPYGWTRTIAFVYDYYDPRQVRISIGGTVGPAGVWAIDSTAPRPETVTPASGVVPYLLYSQFDKGFPPYGLLLVQMTNDSTITTELFVGEQTTRRQLDAGAHTFIR